MRNFPPHSRVFGLLSKAALSHDLFSFNPCGSRLHSSRTHPILLSCFLSSRKMSVDDSQIDEKSDRRASTVEDLNISTVLLKEIIEQKSELSKGSVPDTKLKSLCGMYKYMQKQLQFDFIRTLAKDYAIDHDQVRKSAAAVIQAEEPSASIIIKHEDALRNALSPQYSWLFKRIGRLDSGVKFLVDFRTDILNCIVETDGNNPDFASLQRLNVTLRDLLALWFSVGFLQLERVTWQSPCELLQKISEYEAVHPVRSWADIKRRVGPYRRCFVYMHNSMPGEPLVALHTALCDDIPSSLAGILSARSRMSADISGQHALLDGAAEDTHNINSAVFYSITSIQRGLHGIELGNSLIKRVVRELQVEFPQMTQFATLSPIPGFKLWLLDKMKGAERGQNELLAADEIEEIRSKIQGDFWPELRRLLKNNSWLDSAPLASSFSGALMRLCARYLYLEKHRGYAFCPVANFHLSNGAVLWRINWRADVSLRGMTNSCGIMVNYRYFLEETEINRQQYLNNHVIKVSNHVKDFLPFTETLSISSKL